jgi:hypothetical protein
MKKIRVGVFTHRKHFRHDDPIERLGNGLDGFHFDACHSKHMPEITGGKRRVNEST